MQGSDTVVEATAVTSTSSREPYSPRRTVANCRIWNPLAQGRDDGVDIDVRSAEPAVDPSPLDLLGNGELREFQERRVHGRTRRSGAVTTKLSGSRYDTDRAISAAPSPSAAACAMGIAMSRTRKRIASSCRNRVAESRSSGPPPRRRTSTSSPRAVSRRRRAATRPRPGAGDRRVEQVLPRPRWRLCPASRPAAGLASRTLEGGGPDDQHGLGRECGTGCGSGLRPNRIRRSRARSPARAR